MTQGKVKSGCVEEFNANWKSREESHYNHWTAGKPTNQVQFAFRQHWEVFSWLMGNRMPGKTLEVGCGRGSLSSYFVSNGWDATLLDTSFTVLEIARNIFTHNGHVGTFISGDANNLPFAGEQFDIVASIGLLEHFEDVSQPISEQWRVLEPGGWIFAYIVPERPKKLQRYFNWVNFILKKTVGVFLETKRTVKKQEIFRNDFGSEVYVPLFERFEPDTLFVSGMYSMPMISHSPGFPFSLLPAPMERVLVSAFDAAMVIRRVLTGRHGWLCSERRGQAFLVAVKKRTS